MSSAWIVVNEVANLRYSLTTESRSEKTSMLFPLNVPASAALAAREASPHLWATQQSIAVRRIVRS